MLNFVSIFISFRVRLSLAQIKLGFHLWDITNQESHPELNAIIIVKKLRSLLTIG